MKFIVFADGAGEYDLDYDAVLVEADSPEQAAQTAIAPEHGYGASEDGVVFVCPVEASTVFTINPSASKVLKCLGTVEAAEVLLTSEERPALRNRISVIPRGSGRPLRARRRRPT